MKHPPSPREWVTPLGLIALFVVAFGSAATGAIRVPHRLPQWFTTEPTAYAPAMRANPGTELVFIYIGASTCGASNRPSLPRDVERLKLMVNEKARKSSRTFMAMGIARDWDTSAGIDHLRKYGRFDEVIAGRSWVNTGLLRYMWDGIPGRAATPQVLVVERRLFDRRTPEAAAGLVRDERLVVRKIGADEISRWMAQGAPMPALPPAPQTTQVQAMGSLTPDPTR